MIRLLQKTSRLHLLSKERSRFFWVKALPPSSAHHTHKKRKEKLAGSHNSAYKIKNVLWVSAAGASRLMMSYSRKTKKKTATTVRQKDQENQLNVLFTVAAFYCLIFCCHSLTQRATYPQSPVRAYMCVCTRHFRLSIFFSALAAAAKIYGQHTTVNHYSCYSRKNWIKLRWLSARHRLVLLPSYF